ncbi:hypothetical protein FRC07_009290, partial [Ceratobasidium sp. 392]
IVIPHWAYYDFTGTGVFDAAIASQQTGPESSPPAVASSTLTYSSATRTTATATTTRLIETSPATPLPSGPNPSSSGSSNTGAIVGGVVGGVLGLAVLALIVVVLARKSKQSPQKDEQHVSGGYNPPATAQPTAPMSQYRPGISHPGTPGPEKPYEPR